MAPLPPDREADAGDAVVIPLTAETLHVGKQKVETGRVRVSLRTETIEDVVRETLQSRRAEIERVAIGREITEIPAARTERNVMIIPVVEEILVVEKRLILKEEIRLHFIDSEEVVELPTTIRVQQASITRVPADLNPPDATSNLQTSSKD